MTRFHYMDLTELATLIRTRELEGVLSRTKVIHESNLLVRDARPC